MASLGTNSSADREEPEASSRDRQGVDLSASRQESSASETSARTTARNSKRVSSAELAEKMAQLLEMGYTDKKMNKKVLEECKYKVDAALHRLGTVSNRDLSDETDRGSLLG